MHFSDSKGNIIGLGQKGNNRLVLINPGKEPRVKKAIADRHMFHHFHNALTDQLIPMKVLIEDGRIEHGDYVYPLEH